MTYIEGEQIVGFTIEVSGSPKDLDRLMRAISREWAKMNWEADKKVLDEQPLRRGWPLMPVNCSLRGKLQYHTRMP